MKTRGKNPEITAGGYPGHEPEGSKGGAVMMTLKFAGGQSAGKGNYWNISNGQRVRIADQGVLPGNRQTTYLKIHPLLVMALAPMLGLAYAAFLPFIGMFMLVVMIGKKFTKSATEKLAPNAAFTWEPSAAYLAHKKKLEEDKKTGKADDQTDSGKPSDT
jgi:hypothetical protein